MKNKRLSSMLRVDIRRMAATSLFPIMLVISFVMPILILVMTWKGSLVTISRCSEAMVLAASMRSSMLSLTKI